MSNVRLTAGRVTGYKTAKDQDFLWDSEAPGLAVRATATSDKKAFIWQGRFGSGKIRITIGDVRTWDIDAARQRAREFARMADRGEDPRAAKRDALAQVEQQRLDQARADVTVHEAFIAYIAARRHRWGDKHLAHHLQFMDAGGKTRTRGWRPGESRTTQPGPLHPLMDRRLSELDTAVVGAWLKSESARAPTQAAQAFRALRAFLTWCAEAGGYADVDANLCRTKAVKEAVPRVRAKEEDCLQREQMKPWFAAVRSIGNPVIAAYLQTLLLIGSRREELSLLRWSEVDFQWKTMTIRDKVEGQRIIPLTPYVASLLAALPRRNQWVFSSSGRRGALPGESKKSRGHIVEPRTAHVKALQAAGLPHVTLHGLRRSFGTLAEWCEVPVGVVAQIMGHKPSALAEKHYRRRPIDLLRMWHEKIEAWILNEAGIEFDASVAPGLKLVGAAA